MNWEVSEGGEAEYDGPLVGAAGSDYVAMMLGGGAPQRAIQEIQARGSLQDARCEAVLGLLGAVGVPRAEACQAAIRAARVELLAAIPNLSQDRLLLLLDASFPYIGIQELRPVPLAALGGLRPVPEAYLRRLAADKELLAELPTTVQRQVFEIDEVLLKRWALPVVAQYPSETASRMRALDMDLGAPPGGLTSGRGRRLPVLPRRVLRAGSGSLRQLAEMVGESRGVYSKLAALMLTKFHAESAVFVSAGLASYCTLRVQLLLMLLDNGVKEVASADPLLPLAYVLDTSLAEHRISDDSLAALRLFFDPLRDREKEAEEAGGDQGRFASAAPHVPGRMRMRKVGAEGIGDESRERKRRRREEEMREAREKGEEMPAEMARGRLLGEAGAALRDPSTLYLLGHEIVRRLGADADSEPFTPPADSPPDTPDTPLQLLSRLLQLAMSARWLLRELTGDPGARVALPSPSLELTREYYPLLRAVIHLSHNNNPPGAPDDPAATSGTASALVEAANKLQPHLTRSPEARLPAFLYALDATGGADRSRDVAAGRADYAAAVAMLSVLRRVLEGLCARSPGSLVEWAPFAATLARRVASAVQGGGVVPGDAFWELAFDGILMKLIGVDPQVHDEVLRVLLVAGRHMTSGQLSSYVEASLARTKQSRLARARRGVGEDLEGLDSGHVAAGGYSSGGALTSRYRPGDVGPRGVPEGVERRAPGARGGAT
ncbi:unnamed protein product [Pedinophyceae sp. YPF-701]|nr:unnamed protein product [Pedinophyceae sp. YPF-701]